MEKSNKIVLPGCVPDKCSDLLKAEKCWCCMRGDNPCWLDLAYCESQCPPINLNI